ncbi:MAG: tetratricopeptide repeat protein [Treponema sp.]|jgi:hypothetical protein|nr:tetratricopeptide repeat protein [Treponema sp.]
MLGLAVLYIRGMGSRGTNTSQAVDYYLDVLELDPGNKIANKALAVIRANSAPEELADWLTPERLAKLFPPIPAPALSSQTILIGAGLLAALIIMFTGILINRNVLPNPFVNKNARPTAEFILSSEIRSAPVETGGSYAYILTRNEAIRLYQRALSLFSGYRDEEAKVILNKILESNASDGLKNRARILIRNTEVPGFDNFKRSGNPAYADVVKEPALYRDVHIIWKGMATNLEITNEHTRFDFLVGYDTRRTLEGIIVVVFNHPVAVNTERPLEVLGRVVLSNSGEVRLEGIAIHQTGRLEN